jgi:probable H4MPT-linked C1 transfer pathway protein
MQHYIIGWDIGGAHIKAALLNTHGSIIQLIQLPCPLWKGLDYLKHTVQQIINSFDLKANNTHAITMTGELVDCFANRDEGVQQIIITMQQLLTNNQLFFFAGQLGLLAAEKITSNHYNDIASANWLASIAYTQQHINEGLFIDIGSTTTDILLIKNQQLITTAKSDYDRLCSGELIYTGIIRTPVMVITPSIPYSIHAPYPDNNTGEPVTLMAEYFATMADIYRLTGELNEAHDQSDTADGEDKSILASARRLSRMIGCDFYTEQLPRWQRIAQYLRAKQLETIEQACYKQLLIADNNNSPLIGAGVGRFLIKDIAKNLNRPYIDFADLLPPMQQSANINSADCAPAVAVAYLVLNN